MPRGPRLFSDGIAQHVVQRGNDRMPVFKVPSDYRRYLAFLKDASRKCGCAIHAYVLMTNHVHLLITPSDRTGISLMMQHMGRRYVRHFNRIHGRTGTLWEGRFRASAVQDDGYVLNCMRYIEQNPVRANLVRRPEDYPWSSYRANALGTADLLLAAHGTYLEISPDPETRKELYRMAFAHDFDEAWSQWIRKQHGTTSGSATSGSE